MTEENNEIADNHDFHENAIQKANIDYSAANEYIRAHYNQSQYFHQTKNGLPLMEQIYDGRILQSGYRDERAMLDENGLAIIRSPLSASVKWNELEGVQDCYVPELEKILRDTICPGTKLLAYCFWNPMVRGDTYEISRDGSQNMMSTPTANIASQVHIDTDVGAYNNIDDFLGIVEKNQVVSSKADNHHHRSSFNEISDAIIGGKRFAVVNFWRNVGDSPALSSPLAILLTRYDEHVAFPDAQPNMEKSKWYSFPAAASDEVIVFYQYDRNLFQPSDLWHCAIQAQARDGEEFPPRKSFDIRALVVLDEAVPEQLDRFRTNRTRPFLSFEESGCFCDEQAAIREQDIH